jgi:hypothetical protein
MTMSLETGDHAMIATAMAIALGLVKALESLITWAVKRSRGKVETARVELGSEPSRMIRETYEATGKIGEIVSLRDGDGVPLVYTPRSALETNVKMAEAIRDLSRDQELECTSRVELTRKIDEILATIKKQ